MLYNTAKTELAARLPTKCAATAGPILALVYFGLDGVEAPTMFVLGRDET